MAENKTKNDENLVWTCSECGGHYLLLPVITYEEYSVDEKTGQEMWGDVVDEEPDSLYVEKDNETTGWCKTCNKMVKCVLKPFVPNPSNKSPNLLEDAVTNVIENLEESKPVDSDLENP